MRKWFDIRASGADSADVHIYDEIGGWGINAKQFQQELEEKQAKRLNVYINSPGGDVFNGIAIHSILSRMDVTVHIDGLAASIASIIAMAGKKIIMPENAMMMVHNPLTWTAGNADELREQAELLDKIAWQMAGIYADRTGRSRGQCIEDMDAETWMTGDEAVLMGYADELAAPVNLAACSKFAEYGQMPARIRKRFSACGDDAGARKKRLSGDLTALTALKTQFDLIHF